MLYKSGTGVWRPERRSLPLRGAVAGAPDFAWWDISGQTCVAAYQPIGAESLAASYVNRANPGTYDAVPGVAPTWAAGTGWTFTNTQYLMTGITPDTNKAWSMAVLMTRTGGQGGVRTPSSGFNFGFLAENYGQIEFYNNSGAGNVRAGTMVPTTPQVIAIGGTACYQNGVQVGGAIGGGTTGPAGAILMGRTGWDLQGTIRAVAIYSTTLTADQVYALTERMNDLPMKPWWYVPNKTPVAAYKAIGAPALAQSLVSLVAPDSNDAAVAQGTTHDPATGWTFTAGYLTAPLTANAQSSAIVRFTDGGAGHLFGTTQSTKNFGIDRGGVVYKWGNTVITRAPALAAGILALTPNQGYRNGAPDGSILGGNWGTGASEALLIGGANSHGPGTSKIQAFALYSDALSAAEVAGLTERMRVLPNRAWWQLDGQVCVAAYQPKGAADLADSYINRANPGTYDAAPGVAPGWAANTGWAFTGTQHLNTGVVPAVNATWSFLVRFVMTGSIDNSVLIGQLQIGTNANFIQNSGSTDPYHAFANGSTTANQISVYVTSGVLGVAGTATYKDGSAETGSVGTGTGTAGALWIGNINRSDSAPRFCHAQIQAIAIYSTTLSAADVAELTRRMQAL